MIAVDWRQRSSSLAARYGVDGLWELSWLDNVELTLVSTVIAAVAMLLVVRFADARVLSLILLPS